MHPLFFSCKKILYKWHLATPCQSLCLIFSSICLLTERLCFFINPTNTQRLKIKQPSFCRDASLARRMALLTIFCCHICLYSFTAFSVINENRFWPHLFHFRPYSALRHTSTTYHSYSGNWGRICSFPDNSICDSWTSIESNSRSLQLLWFLALALVKKKQRWIYVGRISRTGWVVNNRTAQQDATRPKVSYI